MDMRQRLSSDGSTIIKSDPGTPDTDPEYYATTFTVSAAGVTVQELSWHTDPTTPVYLQSTIIQVSGAEFGDKLQMSFVSDGNVPAYGPAGTVIKSFGRMNVPLGVYTNGWSTRIEEPGPKVSSAKLVPYGLVPSVEYSAISSTTKLVAIDLVAQE